ncbi:hypothetical protein RvY_15605 [Ramazzottius varieornatus]|uniref:Uncharacterized protein n=1 Tax=Ramazzottius varieornatus TaxID=947166 RepID=A0A1D1VX25_RAMVA|nr:hypothetical protein RvY_15605 [Ramazzottius varieornatus]
MIGLLVSGRPVQSFKPVPGDQSRFMAAITDADAINHIVVFLTLPLPEGIGAGVHFSWPDTGDAAPDWTYLGFLSNQKPSAIYKIIKPRKSAMEKDGMPQSSALVAFGPSRPHQAGVGISLEPLVNLSSVTASASTETVQKTSMEQFCQKMLDSFANYALSFAIQNPANPDESYVPTKAVTMWVDSFKRKLEADPNFWKGS